MKVKVEDHCFEVVLDSKNCVYKFQIENETTNDFNLIKNIVLDKPINSAIYDLVHEIPTKGYSTWLKALQALKVARGEKVLYSYNPKRDEIICRCQGVSATEMKKEMQRVGFSLKQFMQSSSCGLVCQSCRSDLQQFAGLLERKNRLIQGKSYKEWTEIIIHALPGFNDFSDLQLDITKLQLRDIHLPQLYFDLLAADMATKELEIKLTNYLARELQMPIEVRLTALF